MGNSGRTITDWSIRGCISRYGDHERLEKVVVSIVDIARTQNLDLFAGLVVSWSPGLFLVRRPSPHSSKAGFSRV